MSTNVFWSSLAPQLLTAWPYRPIHPTSQSTSHISLIKFNMYFLNIFQCGVCPEAWSTYLGYTLKGNWFLSQQLSNTQTPQLVVDSVPTSSCPWWDLSFTGLMLVVTVSGCFYIQLLDCVWKILFSCSQPPLLALTVSPVPFPVKILQLWGKVCAIDIHLGVSIPKSLSLHLA